ncbi:MAG TPA: Xaa-Pro peptidase family protein [Spirochaetota bacterium]|nr:Xaa-Pro peptidase family protein [Spirochaetota bacterium]HOM39010.1 Xaa-Pro peptidase family protein [Spirochaetota bacterium]HPQ49944.1 Xaa-Pro peptidase family protein [Spirochaetota bacterium]
MIPKSKVIDFQKVLKEKDIDIALIFYYVDLLYFAGTIHANLYAIPKDGVPKLFTRRAPERSKEEISFGDVIEFKSFKEIRNYFNFKKVGIVLENINTKMYLKLLQDLNINQENVVDITELYLDFRMIKSSEEIERIREAGKITERVYRRIKDFVKPGMSEIEVSAKLEELYRLEGHTGENRFRGYNQIGLLTYVLTGESILKSGVHATPYVGKGVSNYIGVGASHKKIEKNIPFVVDTVANYMGYHNDTTRTFVIGKPGKDVIDAFNALKEIYNYMIDIARDVTCEELYIKIIEKVKALGYENNFMGIGKNRVPFIGHGIGIYVDEYPVIAKGFTTKLKPGMTIALEPKIFVESFGGVGIETTFEVTSNGIKPLSNLEPDIFYID